MGKPPSKYFLFFGEKYQSMIDDYFSDEKISIRENLNRRNKKIDIEDLSYRILNHWEQNGLLEVERGEGGKGWRRFSIMDGVWIRLIAELRNFGVSIENIRHIKEQLVNSSDEDMFPSVYPLLEFYTALFLSSRMPISIMIFDDFKILVGTQGQIELATKFNSIGNHIRISLPEILQNMFKDKNLTENHRPILTQRELELIVEIRTGAYKSIRVKMKNGDMIAMEKEKDEKDMANRLHEILKENKYDKIIIDRENGQVVNVTRIIKEKF